VAGARRGTPLEGTRTSITEYGGPSPSPGNLMSVPERPIALPMSPVIIGGWLTGTPTRATTRR
jgi:hypothetical protein